MITHVCINKEREGAQAHFPVELTVVVKPLVPTATLKVRQYGHKTDPTSSASKLCSSRGEDE